MHPFPHTYTASARSEKAGATMLASPQLPDLESAAPPEFGGPGGLWSPETLLCASLADCFVLTFHALSRASRVPWLNIECRVEGLLERIEHVSRFTTFHTFAQLTVPSGADLAKARELLEKAEQGCLIANSLSANRHLQAEIVMADT